MRRQRRPLGATERTAYQCRSRGRTVAYADHPTSPPVPVFAVGVAARDGESVQNRRRVRARAGHDVIAVLGARGVGGDACDVDDALAGATGEATHINKR